MLGTLPCQRLVVVACGAVHPAALGSCLARMRHQVASEIRVVAVQKQGLREATGVAAPYLWLAQWAQTVLVLPATASILGMMAGDTTAGSPGLPLLTAAPKPVVFAPAMPESVWRAQATRRHVARLREAGHYVIDPVAGAGTLTGAQRSERLIGPTPEIVVAHTMHIVLKQLREAVRAEERLVDDR